MGEAKRRNKRLSPFKGKGKVALTVVAGAIMVVALFDFIGRSNNPPLTRLIPERTKGDTFAPIQIIEFIDFQCMECARGAFVIRSFMKQYPSDINLSVKYYPLKELNSMAGAIHAECAARQNMFWQYHDELIAKQNQWRYVRNIKPYLLLVAKNNFLKIDEFKECIEHDDAREVVEHEQRLGEAYFVKSTPTYFINKKMYVGVDAMEKFLTEYFENKRLGLL